MHITEPEPVSLHLLGGVQVKVGGRPVAVPEGSKRLLGFVALNGREVDRRRAAGALWPDVDDERAAGNLRSALWRLRGAGIDVLDVEDRTLHLHPEVRIDVEDVSDWARRVAAGRTRPDDIAVQPLVLHALDLLPGWYDDWVLSERELLRQALLHALDTVARLLVQADRYGEAIEVALTAVSAEPLRETAQLALIDAHLAEGNHHEAVRSYEIYEKLLYAEMGISPSVELRRRLDDRTAELVA